MSKNGWTPQRRKKQAEMIRNWQPWKSSTGAKTKAGKAVSKMNAHKHGLYSAEIKALEKALRDQKRAVLNYIA